MILERTTIVILCYFYIVQKPRNAVQRMSQPKKRITMSFKSYSASCVFMSSSWYQHGSLPGLVRRPSPPLYNNDLRWGGDDNGGADSGVIVVVIVGVVIVVVIVMVIMGVIGILCTIITQKLVFIVIYVRITFLPSSLSIFLNSHHLFLISRALRATHWIYHLFWIQVVLNNAKIVYF